MLGSPELDLLSRAQSGDGDAFVALAEPFRRELLAHSYRLLGSSMDAEEAVQETMLRAWNGLGGYTENRSFRAWLYRIATNHCLDRLDRRKRLLPATAFPPGNPNRPPPAPLEEAAWIEPAPDAWFVSGVLSQDPEARLQAAESVRLAFIAALQLLPPRQRAILILRDVLGWRAKEAAELLDMSLGAANSALYRARSRMAENRSARREPYLDGAGVDRTALERYTRAWERADVDGLTALLREEAVFAMPPFPLSFHGRTAIRRALGNLVFLAGPGEYRLLPAGANLQPAFALYRKNSGTGTYAAFGLQVLDFSEGRIAAITAYLHPAWNTFFGLPERLADSGA